MSDFQEHISIFFYELLKAHKLNASRYKDWVTVDEDYPAFRAFYDRPQTKERSGALSVQIMLDDKSLIEECFAAIGDSHINAINDALEQFALTMFHPIISCCCEYVDREQITKEIWPLKILSKAEIWSGNIAMRKSINIPVNTPTDWLSLISDEFKGAVIKKGYNWITLYCSRLNSDPLIASASLNNSDWPAALKATTSLRWPQIDGFYGARLFILARR
jgi:hypothetical protein